MDRDDARKETLERDILEPVRPRLVGKRFYCREIADAVQQVRVCRGFAAGREPSEYGHAGGYVGEIGRGQPSPAHIGHLQGHLPSIGPQLAKGFAQRVPAIADIHHQTSNRHRRWHWPPLASPRHPAVSAAASPPPPIGPGDRSIGFVDVGGNEGAVLGGLMGQHPLELHLPWTFMSVAPMAV